MLLERKETWSPYWVTKKRCTNQYAPLVNGKFNRRFTMSLVMLKARPALSKFKLTVDFQLYSAEEKRR